MNYKGAVVAVFAALDERRCSIAIDLTTGPSKGGYQTFLGDVTLGRKIGTIQTPSAQGTYGEGLPAAPSGDEEEWIGPEPGGSRPKISKSKRKNEVFAQSSKVLAGEGERVSVYKLYSAAVQDAAASVDVVKTGKIVGVQWAASGDLDADGETFSAELSFSSSSGLTTNDTKSSITAIRQQNGLLTSGAIATGINVFFPLPDVLISEGERVYLHTAGTSIAVTAYIWVEDGLDIAGRQRRLRL